jgi:protein N-terminal amidase
MRAALIQFCPEFKNPHKSIEKVYRIIDRIHSSVDVFIFPEMSLSGYCFDSKEEIAPYTDNLAIELAISIAKDRHAFVQIGYPRKEGEQYFNSICLVDREGKVVNVYDKHFLFEQDELWATEGDGFKCMDTELGRVGFGICMDLNPKKFLAPFTAFEFANFQVKNRAKLLFLSMAWLFPNSSNPANLQSDAREKDEDAMSNYWLNRLLPILLDKHETPVYILICNRIGSEKKSHFGGVSSCFKIYNGAIELIGRLNSISEDALVVDLF